MTPGERATFRPSDSLRRRSDSAWEEGRKPNLTVSGLLVRRRTAKTRGGPDESSD